MKITNILPEKLIESDHVTRRRLKYEAKTPKQKKIHHAIWYAEGAATGFAIVAGVYVIAKKMIDEKEETDSTETPTN